MLHAFADGSPRVTVTLARNVLLLGYRLRTRHIGQSIVLQTIQRTTMPDDAKQARVARAVAAAAAERKPAFDFTPEDEPGPSAHDEIQRQGARSLTARANKLLLRAVRTHPDRWTMTNGPDS